MKVALYLRQSKDSEGDALAVDRQRENCLALAAKKGLEIDPARIYIDNDVSASKSRVRPKYSEMVAAVKRREIDVVIAWNLDRLTRTPREIEDWIDLNKAYGVNLLTSEQSEAVDLSGESGQLVLRIRVAVAKQEVDRKSRRQRESNAQGRSMGIPPTGRRSFGYTALHAGAKGVRTLRTREDGRTFPDYGHEPIPAEAEAIRAGFDLLLAGSSLRSIAKGWNDAGVVTTTGATWTPSSVRGVLTNPRYAGMVGEPRVEGSPGHRASRYDLTTLTPGTWEPLVSLETWAAANEVLRDPGRQKTSGAPRRWLLSGLATCAVPVGGAPCGAPVKAGATRDAVSTYRCSASNHLARKAEPADRLVAETVIERLSRPDASALLIDHEAPDLGALRSELVAAQSRLSNIAELVGDGTLSPDQARGAAGRLRAQVQDIERRMTDAGKVDVLGPLVASQDVREAWLALDVERQRRVVDTLMLVTMTSPGRGTRAPRDGDGWVAHTMKSVHILPR